MGRVSQSVKTLFSMPIANWGEQMVYIDNCGSSSSTYLSTGDIQLNLPMISTHQHRKLITHTLQNPEPVVLRKSLQEALQDLAVLRSSSHNLLQFLDDIGLVGSG